MVRQLDAYAFSKRHREVRVEAATLCNDRQHRRVGDRPPERCTEEVEERYRDAGGGVIVVKDFEHQGPQGFGWRRGHCAPEVADRPGTVQVGGGNAAWPVPRGQAYKSWQPSEPSPIVKLMLERAKPQ